MKMYSPKKTAKIEKCIPLRAREFTRRGAAGFEALPVTYLLLHSQLRLYELFTSWPNMTAAIKQQHLKKKEKKVLRLNASFLKKNKKCEF